MVDNTQIVTAGATSEIWQVWIDDGSGQGLTGLVNTDITSAYYHRNTAATTVVMNTMAAGTVGTYVSNSFKEIDPATQQGWYQVCPANAALIAGAKSVAFCLKSTTNITMIPCEFLVRLTGFDLDSALKITRAAAISNYPFTIYLTGTRTPATGKTVTCTRCLDADVAFTSMANSAAEVGATGTYRINVTSADTTATAGTWKFTAAACDPLIIHFLTQQ